MCLACGHMKHLCFFSIQIDIIKDFMRHKSKILLKYFYHCMLQVLTVYKHGDIVHFSIIEPLNTFNFGIFGIL